LPIIARRGDEELRLFVEKINRYTALGTYLKTFVEGIKKHKTENNFLYPSFTQCVTATGRLSSQNPNFQNQPRARTFPIRKVIVSRFENGKIMEVDFAQLEFRTAVFLAQDKQGMKDILSYKMERTCISLRLTPLDVHAKTQKPIHSSLYMGACLEQKMKKNTIQHS
jgi:hypothetical protein